ncbi:hypothetical protein TNCT_159871 [Trichonephila clavata]|uniref:Uncharacterized protein n=1 Tax=Trichonephila clavata TaxID=2740835 RepID=A0A8X6GPV9_TRICU|nr:hypothetical protein TNCT_159871 [Trichonephila clavata]
MIRSSMYSVAEEHKIMRLRVFEGIYSTFRCLPQTANITLKVLEKRTFVDQRVNKNLAFFKPLPNSVQHSMDRKKESFCDDTPAGQAVNVPYTEC